MNCQQTGKSVRLWAGERFEPLVGDWGTASA